MKKSIYSYVAANNKPGTIEVLEANGFPTPNNPMEASLMLAQFVNEDKDDALAEIASIHPDRDLILSFDSSNQDMSFNFKNDTVEHLSAKGEDSKKIFNEQSLNVLIIAGAVVASLSLVGIIVTLKK